MIENNQKISQLIPFQLPGFIRDNPDYANFISFLQAYYEWLEQTSGISSITLTNNPSVVPPAPGNLNSLVPVSIVITGDGFGAQAKSTIKSDGTLNNIQVISPGYGYTYSNISIYVNGILTSITAVANLQTTNSGSRNLLDYHDIDTTTDQFMQYFVNDFLPNFPKESLINQDKAIKVARQLYQAKGTPASYQFLFRVLYNSDFQYFYTGDSVFKASNGNWYVPKSLSLASNNPAYLTLVNESQGAYRVFGSNTKTIATIENVLQSTSKTEVFISNIERLFQSGEFATIVDSNNQLVYFKDNNIVSSNTPGANTLTAKIVGQISSVNIDGNNRGLFYQPGNPVAISGGLNSPSGHGATATIGTVTAGSIQRITVLDGGFGYQYPNSNIIITNGGGAVAHVGSVNTAPSVTANATLIPSDSIALKRFITIGNTQYNFANSLTANANTTLANAFTFLTLTTYPISSVIVDNGGGGITVQPGITANSTYQLDDFANGDLGSLGILAPIKIVNGGTGYTNNDTIIISGGSGYGAYANISISNTSNGNGVITSIKYVYPSNQTVAHYPLGGLGYTLTSLPTVTINSANTQAANAILSVPGILGAGAILSAAPDRIGSITTINISDYGLDYIAAPNVSLRIQDIAVSNVSLLNLPVQGDLVYQGNNVNNSTYTATVYSTKGLQPYADPAQSIYTLRVFDYNTVPNFQQPLNIAGKNIHLNISQSYTPNLISYGDGTAKATSAFLNGLTIGQGQYIDTSGQPSSSDVLQSTTYNNYTYEITVEKEIAKWKSTLLSLLHPSGMQVLGRFAMRSANTTNTSLVEVLNTGHTLEYYTGAASTTGTISGGISNNIIKFTNLSGANLSNIIITPSLYTPGDIIRMTTSNNDIITSQIISVNNVANTITIQDNVWTTFANVAYGTGNTGNSQINITNITYSYNIVNGGVYSNTMSPLRDMIRQGDTLTIANNTSRTVSSIDYIKNIVYLNSNLTNNVSNSLITINRTFAATAAYIQLFGPIGTQYFPSLQTEDGLYQLTAENGNLILLG